MLRLSKLTDYAVVVLIRLAEDQCCGGAMSASNCLPVQTSPGIAAATSIPEPTVAKVLKSLSASDLVVSQRGARGGYRLAKPLTAISIADVIAAIDGPIALTACVEAATAPCEVRGLCAVRGRWDLVNEAIEQALSSITLADMRAASVPHIFRRPVALADAPRAEAARVPAPAE
jgi:FeS assembly SUF system regulator